MGLFGLLSACDSGPPTLFIPQQSDFRDYASWEKIDLGIAMNDGHPLGPEFGYRNHGPISGHYEIGTILVKEVQLGTSPTEWELFAMSKRGADFNAGGAVDWEFFTLRLSPELIPLIRSRGSNPSDSDSQGHGYGAAVNGVTCNRCHGLAERASKDYTLSGGLSPN